VNAVPYAGSNPLYAHGAVRVRADGRRFEHADGTPFRWLGDTAWMSPDLTLLRTCNAPANASCNSALAYIIADRVAKGFTVYQTYFFGETGSWWEAGSNWTRLNATAFADKVDFVMAAAAEAGLLVALGIGMHSQSVTMPLASLQALAGYTAARYGAHPIVWITAQEVNAPNANASAWAVAAQALYDGSSNVSSSLPTPPAWLGGPPLTAHMWVGPNASAPFAPPFVYGDRPWHSWFATQGGHTGMGVRDKAHYRAYWDWRAPLTGRPQPFLEAEAMYEAIICGPRFAYANDTRAAAWKSVLSGSLGFTYGGAALWLFKRDVNDTTGEAYNPGTWWFPNVALPGSAQVGLMSRALGPGGILGAAWADLVPRFSDPAWGSFVDDQQTVLATLDDASGYVLYSYGAGRELGSLAGLRPGGTYAASWLDPREGGTTSLPPVRAPANGTWAMPPKPDAQDWVLQLQLQ